MRSTQVTTNRRYTKREKKAYQARQRRRELDWCLAHLISPGHFFADRLGSRVPTMRVNPDVL